MNFVDPQGDTIIISQVGSIISNDYIDNVVMLRDYQNNDKYIGAIGGNIDLSDVMPSLLALNSQKARMMGIVDFALTVKTGSDWDMKNNEKTIWGYVWRQELDLNRTDKTKFSFGTYSDMTAADIGNYHYGYVGRFLYSGIGLPSYVLWKGAGAAESVKEFQDGSKIIAFGRAADFCNPFSFTSGDRPDDFFWVSRGILDAIASKFKRH